ncbi:MAG: hypothetical protein ACYDCK_07370 [Thermoplasmatota archaeon]
MPTWVVQQWSVRETDKQACLDALAAIAAHIKTDHPEILGVRTQIQWVGSQAHRGILWAEAYASIAGTESGTHTPACDKVWEPIHRMTLPGTHVRSVWFESEPSWLR